MVNLSLTQQERIPNGKKHPQQMVLGKLDSHMQKNETGPFPHTIHKNRLKIDERPKCETESIKILEENTGSTSMTSATATSY